MASSSGVSSCPPEERPKRRFTRPFTALAKRDSLPGFLSSASILSVLLASRLASLTELRPPRTAWRSSFLASRPSFFNSFFSLSASRISCRMTSSGSSGFICTCPAGAETETPSPVTAPCWTVWTSSWAATAGSKPPAPK